MNILKVIKIMLCLTIFSISNVVNAEQRTIFDQLGGKEAIITVVDDFISIVAVDARINFQFANTDITHLKEMLVDQVCMATGGPCTYKGGDMKSVHVDMNITNRQFNAITEDLYNALKKNGVPYHLQNKLIAMLAPMQHDIVTK